MIPKDIVNGIWTSKNKFLDKQAIVFLKELFDEQDDIKLLKLRANFIVEIETIVQNLKNDEEIDIDQLVINEFFMFFSHQNLTLKVSDLQKYITSAHISTIQIILQTHELKQKYTQDLNIKQFEDICEEIKQNLQDESEECKEAINELLEVTTYALLENKTMGDKAFKNLHERLTAKFIFYKKPLLSIKNKKLKETIKRLWDLAGRYNTIYTKILQMSNNADHLCNKVIEVLN